MARSSLRRLRKASPCAGVVAALALLCAFLAPALAPAQTGQFGVKTFTLTAANEAGEAFTQAGGHPYELTSVIEFNTLEDTVTHRQELVQEAKDVAVDLPAGLIGNPRATPRCAPEAFLHSECPGATQVGTYSLLRGEGEQLEEGGVYNVEPPPDVTVELGILTKSGLVFGLTAGVRAGSERVFVEDLGVPDFVGLERMELKMWGVPAYGGSDPLAGHNPQRGLVCSDFPLQPGSKPECKGGNEPDTDPQAPFLTMPTDCSAGPLSATLNVDSWESPVPTFPLGTISKPQEPAMPAVIGCQVLAFHPTLEVQPESPESARADSPDGLHVSLTVPQTNSPRQNATPELRDAVVTLPPGMTLNPAAADGLQACSDAQFAQYSEAPAACPEKAIVGLAEVDSPLLPKPLKGQLFLGEPLCGNAAHPSPCGPGDAAAGRLFRLFLQARGEAVNVKLAGSVSASQTGQLTTTFAEDPQLPFEHLSLELVGGPRAALANPQSCGGFPIGPGGQPLAMTTSDLTPWSAPYTPDVTPSSGFEVSECPASMGFAPSFTAGTVTPKAGAFTPFTLSFSRHDGEQDLSGLRVMTPPGLVGMLSKVPLCDEPQAAQGTCSDASRIGVVNVASGAGSHPLWLAGQVYLTAAYNGAPFGLSIVVPAVAGPFNLGNVVVRATINIDPSTSALTITSGPLPQLIDGVQTRIQTVNVTVDRPGFMFNPTNCKAQRITAAISGSQNATANVSSPFAAGGCKSLAFKPTFKVSTSGKTSRKNGASLDAKLTYPKDALGNDANIAKVKVSLPKQLPSWLTTLQKACPAATFAANPALCSAGSVVGIARASTPVLPVGLAGPVYFVSHGGEEFPSLIVVLQGDGVRVDLTGSTFISKQGITSSTFRQVPDVPISSFELYLPQGPHHALAANANLCKVKGGLKMPTEFVAQNGAVVKQSTKIAVTGCPKVKKSAKKARTSGNRHNGSGRGK
jgi:hypothetical protein